VIDFDEKTVTDAFFDQIKGTPNKRLLQIMRSAIRHLHAFAREVDLTREEWQAGIEFLTAVGQKSTDDRQEFVLLSDTSGLSTLMNLLEDRRGAKGTNASILGPFYRDNPPVLELGDTLAKLKPGPEAVMYGTVKDTRGRPIPHVLLDAWLADEKGNYDVQEHGPGVDDLRGRYRTDENGRYWFRTTIPAGYSIPMDGPVGVLVRATNRDGMRPAHIHFRLIHEGFQDLVTAVYFKDQYIETDAAFGVLRKLVVEILPPSKDSPIPSLPRIPYDFTMIASNATRHPGPLGSAAA
jgi:protocatechuate 3,4-dioxygenase beta subunit